MPPQLNRRSLLEGSPAKDWHEEERNIGKGDKKASPGTDDMESTTLEVNTL